MVQLLLLLNLFSLFTLFLFLVNLYLSLKSLSFKVDEIERELLKVSGELSELRDFSRELESKLSSLKREVVILYEKAGIRRI
ncbi:hypothetical protein [Thermovibrio sp.]